MGSPSVDVVDADETPGRSGTLKRAER